MDKAKEVDMHLTLFSLGLQVDEREEALQELRGIDEDISGIISELRNQLETMDIPALSEFIASPQLRNELKVHYARERFCGAVRAVKGQDFCNKMAEEIGGASNASEDEFLQEIIDLLTWAAFKKAVAGLADEGDISTEGL